MYEEWVPKNFLEQVRSVESLENWTSHVYADHY